MWPRCAVGETGPWWRFMSSLWPERWKRFIWVKGFHRRADLSWWHIGEPSSPESTDQSHPDWTGQQKAHCSASLGLDLGSESVFVYFRLIATSQYHTLFEIPQSSTIYAINVYQLIVTGTKSSFRINFAIRYATLYVCKHICKWDRFSWFLMIA